MASLYFHCITNPQEHLLGRPLFESRESQKTSLLQGRYCNPRVSEFRNPSGGLRHGKREGRLRISACIATDAAERTSVVNGVGVDLAFDSSSSGVIEAERKYFVGNYARSPAVFVKGEGCKLYDVEGKEYLDLTAGIAVNALGHGDPAWLKAVTEQAATLTHVSNVFHTVPQVMMESRHVCMYMFVYYLTCFENYLVHSTSFS